MALFPQLAPDYYSEKDHSILSRMEHFYTDSITVNQSYWTEADKQKSVRSKFSLIDLEA